MKNTWRFRIQPRFDFDHSVMSNKCKTPQCKASHHRPPPPHFVRHLHRQGRTRDAEQHELISTSIYF